MRASRALARKERSPGAAETQLVGPTKPMKVEKVIIVPHDPDWPRQYKEERALLETVFAGSEMAIDHV